MSLIVYAYRRDPSTGPPRDLETSPTPPRNDLFGFESWRHKVWSAPCVVALGASLLPTLAADDIYAEGDALDRLDGEVTTLLANLDAVAAATEVDVDTLRFRLQNAAEAIRLARLAGPGAGVAIS